MKSGGSMEAHPVECFFAAKGAGGEKVAETLVDQSNKEIDSLA